MKIRSRILTKVIAGVCVALVRLLFRTCRVRVIADVPGVTPYDPVGDERYLYAGWHDQLLVGIFCRQPRQAAGLVSKHQDGSYLADAMRLIGITPVRGSTNRGGARAMREMLDLAGELHIAITPDGPRGPRHELKPGVLFLASHSGRAIIPLACDCTRKWRVQGSWTDMLIPKPFSEIFMRAGPPFVVPPGLSRDQLDGYRHKLEAEIERLEADAARLARGEPLADDSQRAAA